MVTLNIKQIFFLHHLIVNKCTPCATRSSQQYYSIKKLEHVDLFVLCLKEDNKCHILLGSVGTSEVIDRYLAR